MIIIENYRIFIIKFTWGPQAIMFINKIYRLDIWQNDRLSAVPPRKIYYELILLGKM